VKSQPVIIDCNPGIDDALALLLAFATPDLDVRGITTVCGNMPVGRTTHNALTLCELGARGDIGVYAGCHAPLLRAPIHGLFHGQAGLGLAFLPSPAKKIEPVHAVDFLIETLQQAACCNKRVTLCCLGPLTNIALALRINPAILEGVDRLIMMGVLTLSRVIVPWRLSLIYWLTLMQRRLFFPVNLT